MGNLEEMTLNTLINQIKNGQQLLIEVIKWCEPYLIEAIKDREYYKMLNNKAIDESYIKLIQEIRSFLLLK